jgi:hypothetical protein
MTDERRFTDEDLDQRAALPCIHRYRCIQKRDRFGKQVEMYVCTDCGKTREIVRITTGKES